MLEEQMRVPWCESGYYVGLRPVFTFDPLFHAGCYYVQEASSMFVAHVVKHYVTAPVVTLDLCAAPGGKSTLLRSLLPEGSLLVANEVVRNRAQVLVENMTKWGHPDVVVTNSDPEAFHSLPAFFDVVLTDAPCSGEGMFRKEPAAVEEWSPENVKQCQERQRRIMTDVWPSLKPGGLLIYSTCTYNIKENEENVRWMCSELGAEPLPVPEVNPAWRITGSLLPPSEDMAMSGAGEGLPVYRFLPHKTQGEGFFLAVLRKPLGEEMHPTLNEGLPAVSRKGKREKMVRRAESPLSQEQLRQTKTWVKNAEQYDWTFAGNRLSLFPSAYSGQLQTLQSALQVLQAGVTVAEAKGRDFVPAHALAMSTVLSRDSFPSVETDYAQAVAYLRKEAIILSDAPRGILLLTYKGVPLGFVKNVGNRANNLYPQEWRIRSGHVQPEVNIL